jgi:hypothetical protein
MMLKSMSPAASRWDALESSLTKRTEMPGASSSRRFTTGASISNTA